MKAVGKTLILLAATASAGLATGLPWYVRGLLGFAVAVYLVVAVAEGFEMRRKRSQEQFESRQMLLAPIGYVNSVEPTRIGVKGRAGSEGQKDPSPYIQRTQDEYLDRALKKALDGVDHRIIILEGPSTVGKSRTMYQALLRLDQKKRLTLAAPKVGPGVLALLKPHQAPDAKNDRSVLWLDDVEEFLNQGLTLTLLDYWLDVSPQRIVAATLGGKGGQSYFNPSASGLASEYQRLRQHANTVRLRQSTLDEVSPHRHEYGVEEWETIAKHGIAAFQIAAPLIQDKLFLDGADFGGPLDVKGVECVNATIDWTLCGRTDPIPRDVLQGLWEKRVSNGDTSDFERALEWSLDPIARSVSLLSSMDDGFVALDYAVGIRGAEEYSLGDDYWEAAVHSAESELALSVGQCAYEAGRSDVALRAFSEARRSASPLVAASGAFNIGTTYLAGLHFQKSLMVFDEVIASYDRELESTLVELVAKSRCNRGIVLAELGRFPESIEELELTDLKYGGRPEYVMNVVEATALYGKANALAKSGDLEGAIASHRQVDQRFSGRQELYIQEVVANALTNEAACLVEIGEPGKAIIVWRTIIDRYKDVDSSPFPARVLRALSSMGINLGRLERREESVEVWDELVGFVGSSLDVDDQRLVANALYNKGLNCRELGLREQAIQAWEDAFVRFGGSSDAEVIVMVVRSLYNKGIVLSQDGRKGGAIEVWSTVIDQYADVPDPGVRELCRTSLLDRSLMFGAVGRLKESVAGLQEVVASSEVGKGDEEDSLAEEASGILHLLGEGVVE